MIEKYKEIPISNVEKYLKYKKVNYKILSETNIIDINNITHIHKKNILFFFDNVKSLYTFLKKNNKLYFLASPFYETEKDSLIKKLLINFY